MKIKTAATPVERIGAKHEDDEFRIKATPKAFQILTSKLYKDKIAAIVRELSCNAYDSHVESGNRDQPFSVHLPNLLQPELVIRDYGTGLSDRAVRTIFTTFFESTKEGTNEQIGALGLGCKSPFSYTDTYTVKSFFNGRATTYVCFIENSLPKIRRVSGVDSDEPNGVEIRITINPNDFHSFQEKAKTIYSWFEVQPTVSGGRGYTPLQRPAPARSGEGWQFIPSSGVSRAVMGNVAYPLDKDVMTSHLKDFEAKLLDNFVYHFNIGDLDVQAGREELSYDKATITAIRKRIARASNDLSLLCKDMFDDCQTMVEAARRFLSNRTGALFNLVPPRWNGKIITGSVPTPVPGTLLVRSHSKLAIRTRRVSRGGFRKITEVNVIEPWSDIIIFIDDLKRGGKSRYSKFSNESQKPCYFFTPEADDGPVDFDAVVAAFAGYGDIRLTSSLKVERSMAKVRLLSKKGLANASYLHGSHRIAVDVDLSIGGVYLVSKGGDILRPDGKYALTSTDLHMFVKRFWSFDNQPDIYIVPYTLRKKFSEDAGWVNMFDAIFDDLEEKLTNTTFVAGLNQCRDKDDFSINLFDRADQIARLLPPSHAFHRFIRRYNEKPSAEAQAWYPFIRLLEQQSHWPSERASRKFFDRDTFVLRELWKSLDDLPLLKAVASNAPLEGAALADLASYAQYKNMDRIEQES